MLLSQMPQIQDYDEIQNCNLPEANYLRLYLGTLKDMYCSHLTQTHIEVNLKTSQCILSRPLAFTYPKAKIEIRCNKN